ncbi:MAG: amino acid adenylation domain-containing protein, partial [Clostridiaceae bacterium]|nr:amino acid adenylation domain-containing protein [Clostridiaceae bacterium]
MKNTDKYETNIGRNSIIDLFEMQVQLTPDFTALVCGDWWLKYSELNGMVNRLARELITHNVGSEMVVGIMVSRSLEMIISILAVLKAGAAYLPIDPQYPEERISYMLEDSKVQLLLTQSDYYDKVNYDCMKIDVSDERVYNHEETNLCNNISPNSLAYVIYTSGSTGLPKGVMIEHQAVCNFIRGICEIIDFSEGKKILNITTISFDIFLLETILPLTRGVTVVIANEREQKDPEALAKVILKNKIHILQLTPSRLKLLADSKVFASIFESISEILIGGEPFPEVMLPELSKYDKLKIFNMYGPTETTVWSTVKDMTGKNKVSIGKPILNTDIYILDKNNN